MSLDWLIIGGGVHGVHLAARLLGEAGIEPERLAIVDPAHQLLDRWRVCTGLTGMSHLRSPAVHHLDVEPGSLLNFAGYPRHERSPHFEAPYDRPSLALFNAHSDYVISKFGLAGRHLIDRAVSCVANRDHVHTRLERGGWIESQNVILAIGASEQPFWPAWAPRIDGVHHAFEPGFDGWPDDANVRVAVIGGGISAGQIALRLVSEGHRVRLVTRHEFREHQFDSDPGWLGAKNMNAYGQLKHTSNRRGVISAARYQGSVPPDVLQRLKRAIGQGFITWTHEGVREISSSPGGLFVRGLDGSVMEFDRIILATGFESKRPGGELVDSLIESAGLPCAECGYPVPDVSLRWHPRIYVSGPLAELEIGPISRNISGARAAADRILGLIPEYATRARTRGRGPFAFLRS